MLCGARSFGPSTPRPSSTGGPGFGPWARAEAGGAASARLAATASAVVMRVRRGTTSQVVVRGRTGATVGSRVPRHNTAFLAAYRRRTKADHSPPERAQEVRQHRRGRRRGTVAQDVVPAGLEPDAVDLGVLLRGAHRLGI